MSAPEANLSLVFDIFGLTCDIENKLIITRW